MKSIILAARFKTPANRAGRLMRPMGIVRDAKHPRLKEGNHRKFKMTPEAWEIVARQPRTDKRIFPYNARSVSAAFTRACKILGIKDLRFHDGPRGHEPTV